MQTYISLKQNRSALYCLFEYPEIWKKRVAISEFSEIPQFKVVIVGDRAVGKTCLAWRCFHEVSLQRNIIMVLEEFCCQFQVSECDSKAARYFKLAADLGDDSTWVCYALGEGVPQFDDAVKYSQFACAQFNLEEEHSMKKASELFGHFP